MKSPCVAICELDQLGTCIGCARTVDEITQWPTMTEEEQARVVYRLTCFLDMEKIEGSIPSVSIVPTYI